MHQRCIRNGYKVSKENVQGIVKAIDPDGAELQKKQALRRRKYFSRHQIVHDMLMDMIN